MELVLENTGEAPPALRRRVLPDPDNIFYWSAFWQLDHSRAMGFGAVGAIPMTEIKAFCDLYNVPKSEIALLIPIIHNMDNAYLAFQEKKQRRDGNKGFRSQN